MALSLLFAITVDDERVFASGRFCMQLMLRQLMKVLRRLFVVGAILSGVMVRCYCWWLVNLLLVSLDGCYCDVSFSACRAPIHLIIDGGNFRHGGKVRRGHCWRCLPPAFRQPSAHTTVLVGTP